MDLPKYYLSRRQFSAPPRNYRPMSAFPKSWSVIKTEFQRENNSLLYELMFKHGRQLEQFPFTFPRPPRLQVDHQKAELGNAWRCENKAFRQMHSMSARTPGRRMFNGKIVINTDDSSFPSASQHGDPKSDRIRRAKSAPPMRFYKTEPTETEQDIAYW